VKLDIEEVRNIKGLYEEVKQGYRYYVGLTGREIHLTIAIL